MTIVIAVSRRFCLNFSISGWGYGLDAHWRDDFVNIWMHSQPISRPRRSASLTPPPIETWAPSIGRFDSRAFETSGFIAEPVSYAILYAKCKPGNTSKRAA